MNADAQLNRDVTETSRHRDAVHRRPDVDRHVGYFGHVTVAVSVRHAADDHVDAADSFHLLTSIDTRTLACTHRYNIKYSLDT